MNRVVIEDDFRLTVPEALRQDLQVGDELFMSVDRGGRIVLLSEKRVRAILQRTAGLWQGRSDIPDDGVEYVNQMRQGRRLRRLGVTGRAAD